MPLWRRFVVIVVLLLVITACLAPVDTGISSLFSDPSIKDLRKKLSRAEAENSRLRASLEALTRQLASETTTPPAAATVVEEARDRCAAFLGTYYVTRLRDSALEVCSGGNSRLIAYMDPQLHGGLLVGEGLVIDLGKMRTPNPKSGREEDEYFGLIPGSVSGDCRMQAEAMVKARSVMRHSTAEVLSAFSEAQDGCDDTFEKPVLLVTRYEYANMFHTFTDYWNAFVAMRLLGLRPSDWSVFFFDGHPPGALDDPWMEVFSPLQKQPLTLLTQFGGKRLCFKKVIFAMPGYNTHFFQTSSDSERCRGSALLDAYRAFTLGQFGLPADARPSSPVLTMVIRRPYVAHPRNPTGRVLRKWANEGELLAAATAAGLAIHTVDFANMTYRQQVEAVSRTSVLIGIHGAGLTHEIFLPKGSVLVEVPEPSRGRHFENLAVNMNLTYLALSAQTLQHEDKEVEPKHFVETLRAAIGKVGILWRTTSLPS